MVIRPDLEMETQPRSSRISRTWSHTSSKGRLLLIRILSPVNMAFSPLPSLGCCPLGECSSDLVEDLPKGDSVLASHPGTIFVFGSQHRFGPAPAALGLDGSPGRLDGHRFALQLAALHFISADSERLR